MRKRSTDGEDVSLYIQTVLSMLTERDTENDVYRERKLLLSVDEISVDGSWAVDVSASRGPSQNIPLLLSLLLIFARHRIPDRSLVIIFFG